MVPIYQEVVVFLCLCCSIVQVQIHGECMMITACMQFVASAAWETKVGFGMA